MSHASFDRQPSFLLSFITFAAIVTVIGIGLFILGTSLHSLMLICLLIAGVSAKICGAHFTDIRQGMNSGIERALSAIYIFFLIGILIAAFIQSGTVTTLIYYGLQLIDPMIFLPAGLILCSFMSIATGTSWGTVGTAGIVLMGMGAAMDMPLPIVAGVVVSGACFGDKMSPVSDTTNLAAMSAKTDLYDHIKSMMYTTIPTYIICLAVFTYLGLDYADHSLPAAELSQLLTAIEQNFSLSPLTLLPLLVMIVLILRKVDAEPAMIAAALTAILLAIFLQDKDPASVLGSLYQGGGKGSTGIESLDSLLGRGGITSMMWTLSLALMALALGGILEYFGFLKCLMQGLVQRIKSAGSLVATTILSCLVGNMSMGEAYMTIILGGQLFGDSYDQKQVKRTVLSRSLEEGATLTTALIPWTTGGAFFASTLGVSVLEYAPWALLNWMNGLIAIIFAYCGIALFKK